MDSQQPWSKSSEWQVVDNEGHYTAPPTDAVLSAHRITSSAVVLIPNVGTLEALANTDGYRFEKPQMRLMRQAAVSIASIVQAF